MSISSSSLIDNRSDPYPSGGGPSVVHVPSLNRRGIGMVEAQRRGKPLARQREPSGLYLSGGSLASGG